MDAGVGEGKTSPTKVVEKAVGDGKILEVVQFGMKSLWVEHFSMETPAAVVVRDDKFKGLPPSGLTFMVSRTCLFFRLIFI